MTICRVPRVSVTGFVERPEEPQLDCIIKWLGVVSEMHSTLYYECQNVVANYTVHLQICLLYNLLMAFVSSTDFVPNL